MRDLVIEEALEKLAVEAADCLSELSGEDGDALPYEVIEEPGSSTSLYRYLPLTNEFIRANAAKIRSLESFGTASAAIESAGIAGRYLEGVGAMIPPDPSDQAQELIIVFLSRLWEECSDFELEAERFDDATREIERFIDGPEGPIEVIAPVIGLRMTTTRVELPDTTLIRGETVDVPHEVRMADAAARAPWEPQILAHVRCAEGAESDAPAGAVHLRFRSLITALRLFKAGGVGLGPYAWTRTGEDRWRRISTLAARPRPGGYHLAESELEELIAFSAALQSRRNRSGTLKWAIGRFEMGVERAGILEAMSDYLLALRSVLEGDGPADAGLAMRVAALCAEPHERQAVRATIERGLKLERGLMRGASSAPTKEDEDAAVGVASEIEDYARAILRDAAAGHLGHDLRATADEILLADGVAIAADPATREVDADHEPDPDDDPGGREPLPREPAEATDGRADAEPEVAWRGSPGAPSTPPWAEPVLAEEGVTVEEPNQSGMSDWMGDTSKPEEPKASETDADDSQGDGFEWPVPWADDEATQRAKREDIAKRVRHLFPEPETTDWSVGELDYDRRRSRRAG